MSAPASEKLINLLRRFAIRGDVWYAETSRTVDIIAVSKLAPTGWSVQRTVSRSTLKSLEDDSSLQLSRCNVPDYDPPLRSAMHRKGGRIVVLPAPHERRPA